MLDINARGPNSSVMFLSGSGTACDVGGTCIDITQVCDLYVAPRGGGVVEATGLDRQQRLNAFFPFVGNQNPLNVDFRATTSCNVGDSRFFAPPEEPYSRKHERAPPPNRLHLRRHHRHHHHRPTTTAAATATAAATTTAAAAAATAAATPRPRRIRSGPGPGALRLRSRDFPGNSPIFAG